MKNGISGTGEERKLRKLKRIGRYLPKKIILGFDVEEDQHHRIWRPGGRRKHSKEQRHRWRRGRGLHDVIFEEKEEDVKQRRFQHQKEKIDSVEDAKSTWLPQLKAIESDFSENSKL